MILSIPLSRRQVVDDWFWCSDSKGTFSVKNSYRVITGELGIESNPIWKKIWCLKVSNKVKKILWRASVNCLPTNVALTNRRVPISALYPLCGL